MAAKKKSTPSKRKSPRKRPTKRSPVASRRRPFLKYILKRPGRRSAFVVGLNIALIVLLGIWYSRQPEPRQKEVRQLLSNYMESENNILVTDIIWDLYQYYYGDQFVTSEYQPGHEFLYGGIPQSSDPSTTIKILQNKAYTCGYAEAIKSPLWVAYRVFDNERAKAPEKRPDGFDVDTRTLSRVRSSDYTGSGFDRGHLAPNYAIARCYGRDAQLETFLMSNIVPQTHAMNAGPWKDIEMRAAVNYPSRFQEVWVITGPIYSEESQLTDTGIRIPNACYKIFADETEGKLRLQAVIIPQQVSPSAPLESYLVTVDDIERLTGLDFFPELDDFAEQKLEASFAKRLW